MNEFQMAIIDYIVMIMKENRRRYPKYWEKIRIDRISKIVPSDKWNDSIIEYMKSDTRFKFPMKEDDFGNMVPAIQLRYETFISKT